MFFVRLTSTIKDFEILLSLKEELGKMKQLGRCKLEKAHGKRVQLRHHLEQLDGQLDEIRLQIKGLKEENDSKLAELDSKLLETASKRPAEAGESGKKDPSPLSDLIALVSDSQPGDTQATLKEKMQKSVDECDAQLADAENMADWLIDRHKVKNIIQLTVNGRPVPITGKPGLFSYLAFSLADKDQPLEAVASADLIDQQPSKDEPKNPKEGPPVAYLAARPAISPPSSSKLLLMAIWRQGVLQGEVQIVLKMDWAPIFIHKLTNFCQSPVPFAQTITKAVPGICVLIPMAHPRFQPITDELKLSATARLEQANQNADVGITMVERSVSATGVVQVMGWSLLFPLNFFTAKESLKHVQNLPPAPLLGHVKKGINLIVMLTRLTRQQTQNEISFTLEAR